MSTNHFYELFSQYMELVIERDSETEVKEYDLYHQLLNTVESQLVSSADVIRAFAAILAKHPSHTHHSLLIMDAIVVTSQMNNGYSYPEFFWLLVNAGVFTKISDINEFMRILHNICNRDVLRAYLISALLTGDGSRYKDIIRAFYHVGYTMESLKMVTQAVPLQADNLDIYEFVYSDVMSFVYSDRATSLSIDERDYLIAFFKHGLSLEHPHISESCQKALSKLVP